MWRLHCKTPNLKGENIISRISILKGNNTTPSIHVVLAQYPIKTSRGHNLSQDGQNFQQIIIVRMLYIHPY